MKTKSSIAITADRKTMVSRLRTSCATRLMPLLLLLTLPAVVQAQFAYTTNNGTITITGYIGTGGAVTIPDTINGLPVTGIGDWAFFNCSSLTSVTITNSVTNIGDGAFYGCSSLTNVTIGNSVSTIAEVAFVPCTSLCAITVYTNNPAYSSVAGVLFDKSQTTLIQYPSGKAGSYTIPNSVSSIGYEAFVYCACLSSITISPNVTAIMDDAFYGCIGLTNLIIGNNVTNIGSSAFQYCASLTNVMIPDSVTSIGEEPFGWCFSLTAIIVDTNNPAYSGLDGVLFDKSQTTLIQCPGAIAGIYTIPHNVMSIGFNAFGGCTSLTNVTISDSVTNVGEEPFGWCFRLTTITVDTNNPTYSSLCGLLFDKNQTLLIECPRGKVGSYTIPNGVTNIGDYAFCFCPSLTSVTVPFSVTSVGDEAFCDCTSLAGVYFLGNAPTNDGWSVFLGDDNTTVYYLTWTTGWGSTFSGRPTAPWNPQMQTGGSIDRQSNQFGFNINWASGQAIVVEACTNFANPVWQPVQTNTLTSGSCYFSDPAWTNYPSRFYRLRSP